MNGFGLTMKMALIMMKTRLGTDSSLLPWPMVPVTSSVMGLEMVLLWKISYFSKKLGKISTFNAKSL